MGRDYERVKKFMKVVSTALFKREVLGEELTEDEQHRIDRYRIAERFGWTLQYIDELDDNEYGMILGWLDAPDKIEAHGQSRARMKIDVIDRPMADEMKRYAEEIHAEIERRSKRGGNIGP